MTFAIAISLVLIASTATLLYQYWTAALAADDESPASTAFPARPVHPSRIDVHLRPDDVYRTDTAA